ncbi:MAG: hypothetical protein J7K98_03620 [Candidatus Aenigmarchaeota archaeon]|nr:hypothetical protein [Candidatus Aenigmarchaeota archaeon]
MSELDEGLYVEDFVERSIILTANRLQHILKRPEMKGEISKIRKTLKAPDEVRKSVKYEKVLLFYKFFDKTSVSSKYLAVVVKILNNEGFIITSYFTDRIKKCEIV